MHILAFEPMYVVCNALSPLLLRPSFSSAGKRGDNASGCAAGTFVWLYQGESFATGCQPPQTCLLGETSSRSCCKTTFSYVFFLQPFEYGFGMTWPASIEDGAVECQTTGSEARRDQRIEKNSKY